MNDSIIGLASLPLSWRCLWSHDVSQYDGWLPLQQNGDWVHGRWCLTKTRWMSIQSIFQSPSISVVSKWTCLLALSERTNCILMFAWVLIFINSNFYIFQHDPTCFFCNLTTTKKQMLPPCLLQWEAPVKTLLFSSFWSEWKLKKPRNPMSSYKIIQVICDHCSPSLVAPNVPVWEVHSMKLSFVRQLEILCSPTSGFEKLPCRRPSWRSDERNRENT